MTYWGFLGRFVGLPLCVLALLTVVDARRGRALPPAWRGLPAGPVLAVLIAIAVLYTTPWDNYLVATRVWWYDPALVMGVTIGWVPIEEYTFFAAQTALVGLWVLFLARRLRPPAGPAPRRPALRWGGVAAGSALWLVSLLVLLLGWEPGTYLALTLVWSLPPILLQLGFGADILWHHRRLVLWGVLPAIVYLSAADALAIVSGTWTINPARSVGIYLGSLPLEELVFFIVTNVLIGVGLSLALARESRQHLEDLVRLLLRSRGR